MSSVLENLRIKDSKPSNWVPILEEPIFNHRKLRVVCIGAGLSGITLAYKIKHEYAHEDKVELVIYEKNSDIGGTWFENVYPGAACDVPAHCYTFPFAPNPNWSKFMAPGAEIHKYIKDTAATFGLEEPVQFNSTVQSAQWDDATGKWNIRVSHDGKIIEDTSDVLVNATGFLSAMKWPEIEGLDDFKGKLLHTAKWDTSYDWHGKKVGVIGNGSSGIQIVTAMQPKVSHLTNYLRSPTWIAPNFAADPTKDGKNFTYTEEEKESFRTNKEAFRKYLKEIEHTINSTFFVLQKDTPMHDMVQAGFTELMKSRMTKDSELAERMIPKFKAGCRRISPGDGYLEALQEPNCSPNWSPIKRISPTGIETADGKFEELDLLVCATGFNTKWIPQWKLVGKNGATLQKTWKDDPSAFMGVSVADMPNYFVLYGPNSPVGNGSVLRACGWQCDFIMKTVKKLATEDIKSLVVKSDALSDYNVYAQEIFKRTVWSDTCRTWYKSGKSEGNVTGVYQGSTLHYKDLIENAGFEHYDIEYRSANRFTYMGNGTSIRDADGAGDLAYYMDDIHIE